jgi:septum formation protein
VRFKRLTDREIEGYLATEEWRGKAGAYAIQGRAGGFVIEVQGSYSAVIGLPLYETRMLLEGLGFRRP